MDDDRLNLDQHISQRFNAELESARADVLRMGGIVEDQCRKAVQALVGADLPLAREVSSADFRVNELEVAINAKCTDMLALRQPAASDLRMIIAIIRMACDLERVGDEAEKIARLTEKLLSGADSADARGDVRHLGASAVNTLHGALDAFARLDVEAAIATAAQDADVDAEFESVTRVLITRMAEQPTAVTSMLKVNWCARALERIGDHAVNICEEVIFLVKGADVRHLSLQDIRDRFS